MCSGLTAVTLPDSLLNIGDSAFGGTGLSSIVVPDNVVSIEFGAFQNCSGLTNVSVGPGLADLGDGAFFNCTNLISVYFKGNAPSQDSSWPDPFQGDLDAIVYYLPGTGGWGQTFSGRPTSPWTLALPIILSSSVSPGNQTSGFGFTISWGSNQPVVVEASTDLSNPSWLSVSTNRLTNGSAYFSDPAWTNYPSRFYRLVPRP